MKVWHISDTHTFHDSVEIINDVDIVIHSGDACNSIDVYQNRREMHDFIRWYSKLPVKYKIFVAGNHDTSVKYGLVDKEYFEKNGITYLVNETVSIDGVKITGIPYTATFSIGLDSTSNLKKTLGDIIGKRPDVLVTHGPPIGVFDLGVDLEGKLERCGCPLLYELIAKTKPRLSLFGHMHNMSDIINQGTLTFSHMPTKFSNASVVTDNDFGLITSSGNVIEL